MRRQGSRAVQAWSGSIELKAAAMRGRQSGRRRRLTELHVAVRTGVAGAVGPGLGATLGWLSLSDPLMMVTVPPSAIIGSAALVSHGDRPSRRREVSRGDARCP